MEQHIIYHNKKYGTEQITSLYLSRYGVQERTPFNTNNRRWISFRTGKIYTKKKLIIEGQNTIW
jgi:hypothetical protein